MGLYSMRISASLLMLLPGGGAYGLTDSITVLADLQVRIHNYNTSQKNITDAAVVAMPSAH